MIRALLFSFRLNITKPVRVSFYKLGKFNLRQHKQNPSMYPIYIIIDTIIRGLGHKKYTQHQDTICARSIAK